MAYGPARYREVKSRKVTTTDATVTNIDTFPVKLNRVATIEAIVTGIRTGGSGGSTNDSLGCKIVAAFNNTSGTAAKVGGADIQKSKVSSQGGWDVGFVVSGGLAQLQVTGAANNNITWNAQITVADNIA